MTISLKEIIDFIKYMWPRRKTKHGLFLIIILAIIIIRFSVPLHSVPLYVEFTIYLNLIYFLWVFWLFNSGRLAMPTPKYIVAIALKSLDPNTQKIVTTTFSKVSDKLKILNLLESIKLKEIGVDIFDTKEEAEKFLLKRKFSLVIHGSVYGGNENSKYKYDLRNFFFTYRLLNVVKDSPDISSFTNDMKLMIAKREWIINESNDSIDSDKVANNLVEIILSIIAISMSKSFKHLEFSIKLIETILPILQSKIDPKYKLPRENTRVHVPIDFIRSGRLRYILNNCYISIADSYIIQKEWSSAFEISKKGLIAGADSIDCLAVMALSSYFLKNISDSIKYTDEINNIVPDHHVYLLNKAFFAILQSDYSSIPRYYDKLRRKIDIQNKLVVKSAIEFLEERQNEQPDEIAFLFSIGILNYNYIDKNNGENLLNKFISKAENINKYSELISVSRRILNL